MSFRAHSTAINKGNGTAGRLVNDPELYNSLSRTVAQLESISNDIKAGRGTAGKFVTDDALYNETKAAIARPSNIGRKDQRDRR